MNTEPVLIEYGFIDDNQENIDFLNNNYKELAEAVIKSVLEYKNIPYTPPISEITTTHTVKKGDTLYSLAKQYNTTIEQIKQLNNLTSNTLTIGKVLKLPTKQVTTKNKYIIQKGDTLYSIAKQNNTTIDKIKELNNLTTNTLTIGKTLLLPSTELIEITSPKTYIVKKGDTLYSLAKQYNTTVDQIKQLNNLNTNNLTIGKTLQIPTKEIIETPTTTITYTVKPGDTLYSIARENNTTVNNLKELNNLSTNILSIGQTLIISP